MEVFSKIVQLRIIISPFLGLKGNIQMARAGRLCTEVFAIFAIHLQTYLYRLHPFRAPKKLVKKIQLVKRY